MLDTENIRFSNFRIPFSKFSDVLPAFTCARDMAYLWNICLGANILSPSPCVTFVGDIPLLKALRVNYWPS